VFEATLGLALKLGLKAHILPPISDVDTFEDLAGIADTELPANTEIVVDRLRPRLGSGEGWLL
jgi:glycosyltransferase A (GT-A) superfamily protein (DUF2064 family)